MLCTVGCAVYACNRQVYMQTFVHGYLLNYSLVNIYKELTNDIEDFQAPKHGYLMGWAKQGRYSEQHHAILTCHYRHQQNLDWTGLYQPHNSLFLEKSLKNPQKMVPIFGMNPAFRDRVTGVDLIWLNLGLANGLPL